MFGALERIWEARSRIPVLMVSAGTIVAIALVDWRTPPYVSLGFLYLFPIIVAAGFLPRFVLVALAALCAGLYEAFSSLGPEGRSSRLILVALAFAGCGLFVSEIARKRRLSVEIQQRLRALVETSPAAIVTLGSDGMIETANRAAFELLVPSGNLLGQSIGCYLPELLIALRRAAGTQFRTSMRCPVSRGTGDSFMADVWFSTYREKGAAKLAAIIADAGEEHAAAGSDGAPLGADETASFDRASLNSRQVAVLRLVFEGLSNRQIESRLDMTASAVKNTLKQLFSKMGARNRSQMVRVALERYRDLL